MHRDLVEPYLFSQPPSANHQASPLIDFLVTVARVNWSICEAVLNSGFLDMLVCMYTCNFTSDLGSVENIERGRDSIIGSVCVALETLCCQPEARAAISRHPICVLWPTKGPLPSALGDRRTGRQAVWRRLGPVIISRRLSSIRKLLCSLESTTSSRLAELPDAQADLLEFSRRAYYLLASCIKTHGLSTGGTYMGCMLPTKRVRSPESSSILTRRIANCLANVREHQLTRCQIPSR
jgi:hypothetical protein